MLATSAASYLGTLNPEQRRAVEHGVTADGHVGSPLLVIAGAGSRFNPARQMRHLVCVCFHEGQASRGARDIVMTGGYPASPQTDRQGAARPPSGCRRWRLKARDPNGSCFSESSPQISIGVGAIAGVPLAAVGTARSD